MNRNLWLAPLCLALLACEGGMQGREASRRPSRVVDSLVPIDVALEHFRDGLPKPEGLGGGAGHRDTLVRRVIDALQASDTMAFERLAVNRAEWAWLYYPTNVLAKPPYELPPALAWFQLQGGNRKGVFRALREFGGHRLDYRGYRCNPEPTVEGENRIWIGCTVTLGRDGGAPVAIQLFSALLERGGRFAVLSYDNDL